MRIKHVAAIAAAFTLTLGLAACSGSGAGTTAEPSTSGSAAAAAPAAEGALVGVAMPTKSSERWIADGNNVKTQLEALGYKVDLQYAEDDIPTQVNQIDTMITKGAKLLIIASIDGTALTSQLEQAHANGIQVIAYDRLIRNSANVDYYSTFDNFKVGVQQATSLLTGLGVLDASGKDAGKTGPLNVELFAGSPDDNNATFFFNGAMSILQPYIDKKVIVVKSGQTDFKTVATLRWDPATAQSRMENLLTSTYADGSLVSGVLSPYDGLSIGILGALKGVGYGTASQPWPIVTGQDAEAASVKSIIAGEQYSTIYKDTRELAKVTVAMTDAILKGNTPKVTDTKTYDNGVKVVPSYLLDSQIIVKDNYKKVLVDGGYYTEADLS
ncbi:MAG TPA: multiple monosaccharide ABC transporter substrate-binding protein [Cellulomonas sp.]|uniref:multiple monosaccharide ABC transporter substrate-binding protein n=1 Tax=Cellulomonas sp. TaxID=40001 RepID=UPI002E30E297|nr:multiple monosaccharide ABC transporter substrate-binding protein [Cellulomonas sp.]HEX5331818.1 multiple monosaccharide ABC transporter substrate-binding protein [Cellulomonas sp.]